WALTRVDDAYDTSEGTYALVPFGLYASLPVGQRDQEGEEWVTLVKDGTVWKVQEVTSDASGLLGGAAGTPVATPVPLVVPPFDPSTIPNMAVWLKADALSLSDGDPIGTWTDSSGNSHNGTQATTANKMIFKTNIQNGLPVARLTNPSGPQW